MAGDPTTAIETLAEKLRIQMKIDRDVLIPKDLAVVVTKTDCGVFGDPCELDSLPRQRPPYNPKLTDEISGICTTRLNELGLGELVNKAETNFANVRFFGVSALGTIPRISGAIDPSRWVPRRVEDPFLWILHQWGLV